MTLIFKCAGEWLAVKPIKISKLNGLKWKLSRLMPDNKEQGMSPEECYRAITRRMHSHVQYAVIIELEQATESIKKHLKDIPPKYRFLKLIPVGTNRYAWIAFNPGYSEHCALTSGRFITKALAPEDARYLLQFGKWVLLDKNQRKK